jgi:hypothetical protein
MNINLLQKFRSPGRLVPFSRLQLFVSRTGKLVVYISSRSQVSSQTDCDRSECGEGECRRFAKLAKAKRRSFMGSLPLFLRAAEYRVGDRPESFLKMRLNCDKDIHGSGMCLILVTRFS